MFITYLFLLKFHILHLKILQFLNLFYEFLFLLAIQLNFYQKFYYDIYFLYAIFYQFNFEVKQIIIQQIIILIKIQKMTAFRFPFFYSTISFLLAIIINLIIFIHEFVLLFQSHNFIILYFFPTNHSFIIFFEFNHLFLQNFLSFLAFIELHLSVLLRCYSSFHLESIL